MAEVRVIDTLVVEITADLTAFRRAMAEATGMVQGLGKQLGQALNGGQSPMLSGPGGQGILYAALVAPLATAAIQARTTQSIMTSSLKAIADQAREANRQMVLLAQGGGAARGAGAGGAIVPGGAGGPIEAYRDPNGAYRAGANPIARVHQAELRNRAEGTQPGSPEWQQYAAARAAAGLGPDPSIPSGGGGAGAGARGAASMGDEAAEAAGKLRGFTGSLDAFARAVGNASKQVLTFGLSLVGLGSLAGPIARGFVDIATIVGSRLAPALLALSGPIGLAVAGVTALLAVFVASNWDAIGESLAAFGDRVDEVLGERWVGIVEAAKDVMASFADLWATIWGGVSEPLQVVYTTIAPAFAFMGEAAIRVLDAIGAAIQAFLTIFADFVRLVDAVLRGDFTEAFAYAGDMVEGFFDGLVDMATSIAPEWEDALSGLYEGAKDFFGKAWFGLISNATAALRQFLSYFGEAGAYVSRVLGLNNQPAAPPDAPAAKGGSSESGGETSADRKKRRAIASEQRRFGREQERAEREQVRAKRRAADALEEAEVERAVVVERARLEAEAAAKRSADLEARRGELDAEAKRAEDAAKRAEADALAAEKALQQYAAQRIKSTEKEAALRKRLTEAQGRSAAASKRVEDAARQRAEVEKGDVIEQRVLAEEDAAKLADRERAEREARIARLKAEAAAREKVAEELKKGAEEDAAAARERAKLDREARKGTDAARKEAERAERESDAARARANAESLRLAQDAERRVAELERRQRPDPGPDKAERERAGAAWRDRNVTLESLKAQVKAADAEARAAEIEAREAAKAFQDFAKTRVANPERKAALEAKLRAAKARTDAAAKRIKDISTQIDNVERGDVNEQRLLDEEKGPSKGGSIFPGLKFFSDNDASEGLSGGAFGDLIANSERAASAVGRVSGSLRTLRIDQRSVERLALGMGDAFGRAAEDFILAGAKMSDVLKALGRDIAAMLIRQTITAPLAGWVSKGIGALFGFAGGTNDAPANVPILVGERGPELIRLKSPGVVASSDALRGLTSANDRGANDGMVLNYAPTIDARGADAASVARIEQALRQDYATRTAQVTAIVREGQARRRFR